MPEIQNLDENEVGLLDFRYYHLIKYIHCCAYQNQKDPIYEVNALFF